MRKVLSLVVLSSVLAACSSTDSVDINPAELVDFEPSVELNELWSKDIGSGQDSRYSSLTPVISGDNIYAATAEGDVVSLQRNNGSENWTRELEQELSGGVGVGPNLVLVGNYIGIVTALDRETGAQVWQSTVSSEILSAPKSNGSVVVVQTLDGHLFGLNAEDGSQLWRFDNQLPVLTLRGTADPLMSGDNVYAGFSSGKVVGLRASDGVQNWEQRVAVPQGKTELERVVDIDATPLLVGEILYVSSYQGRLMAISRANGRPLWAVDSSSHQDISAFNGLVFVSGDNDKVRALKSGSGDTAWENDKMERRKLGAPTAFSSYVAVADYEGYVHILDSDDGRFVAREKVDGDGVRASMVTDGETLYVYGNSGELIAYTVK